jgi:hypothetical protein
MAPRAAAFAPQCFPIAGAEGAAGVEPAPGRRLAPGKRRLLSRAESAGGGMACCLAVGSLDR